MRIFTFFKAILKRLFLLLLVHFRGLGDAFHLSLTFLPLGKTRGIFKSKNCTLPRGCVVHTTTLVYFRIVMEILKMFIRIGK